MTTTGPGDDAGEFRPSERVQRSATILDAMRDAAGRSPSRFDALLRGAFPRLACGGAPRTHVEEQAAALRTRVIASDRESDTGRLGVIPVAVFGRATPIVTEIFLRVHAVADESNVASVSWIARACTAAEGHLQQHDVPFARLDVACAVVPPYAAAEVRDRSLEAAAAVAIVSEVMRWPVPDGTSVIGALDASGVAVGVRFVDAKVEAALDAVARGANIRRVFVPEQDAYQLTDALRRRASDADVTLATFATLENLLSALGAPWLSPPGAELPWASTVARGEDLVDRETYVAVAGIMAIALAERGALAFVRDLRGREEVALVIATALLGAPSAALGVVLALRLRRRLAWLAGWVAPGLTIFPAMMLLRGVVSRVVGGAVDGAECSRANCVTDIAPKDFAWWVFAFGLAFVVPVVRLADVATRIRQGRSIGTVIRLLAPGAMTRAAWRLVSPAHPRFTTTLFPAVFVVLLVQTLAFLGRCSWGVRDGAWSPWLKPHMNMIFIQSFLYWLLAIRCLESMEARLLNETLRSLPAPIRAGLDVHRGAVVATS